MKNKAVPSRSKARSVPVKTCRGICADDCAEPVFAAASDFYILGDDATMDIVMDAVEMVDGQPVADWPKLSEDDAARVARDFAAKQIATIPGFDVYVADQDNNENDFIVKVSPESQPETALYLDVQILASRGPGYIGFSERSFAPRENLYAGIVVFGPTSGLTLFLVPSLEWLRHRDHPLFAKVSKRRSGEEPGVYALNLHGETLEDLGHYYFEDTALRIACEWDPLGFVAKARDLDPSSDGPPPEPIVKHMVYPNTLVKRINRRLCYQNRVLRKSRNESDRREFGEYYIVENDTLYDDGVHVDIEALGLELGALKEDEVLVGRRPDDESSEATSKRHHDQGEVSPTSDRRSK